MVRAGCVSPLVMVVTPPVLKPGLILGLLGSRDLFPEAVT